MRGGRRACARASEPRDGRTEPNRVRKDSTREGWGAGVEGIGQDSRRDPRTRGAD